MIIYSIRANIVRIKYSAIFKGKEFKRFNREGALIELLKVYILLATCIEYKLGRYKICLIKA